MTQTFLPSKVLHSKYLINKNVINQMFLYWPSYRANTPVTGPIPQLQGQCLSYRANTPVTGPIQNYLIDNVIL